MIATALLEQPCNKSYNINKLATARLLTTCSKLVDNLEQAVRTQLVDGLFADLLQVVRFLRVYIHASANNSMLNILFYI